MKQKLNNLSILYGKSLDTLRDARGTKADHEIDENAFN